MSRFTRAIGTWATLLLFAALPMLGGCQTPDRTSPEDPGETTFEVYHLYRYGIEDLTEEEARTLRRMIEDAVGHDTWVRTGSQIRIMDGLMTIRTTRQGHEQVQQLLTHVRAAQEAD